MGSIKNYDYVKPSNDGNDLKLGLYVADNDAVSDLLDQNWTINQIDNDYARITDSDGFNIGYNLDKDLLYLTNKADDTNCHWRLIKMNDELFQSKDINLPYHTRTRNNVELNNFIYFIKHRYSNMYLNGGSLVDHTRFNTKYYKRKFNVNRLDYVSKDDHDIEYNNAAKRILELKNKLFRLNNKLLQNNNHKDEKERISAEIIKQEEIIRNNPKEMGIPVRNVFLDTIDLEAKDVPTVWPWIIIPKTLLRSDIEYGEVKKLETLVSMDLLLTQAKAPQHLTYGSGL